jgi:hypothetical protein
VEIGYGEREAAIGDICGRRRRGDKVLHESIRVGGPPTIEGEGGTEVETLGNYREMVVDQGREGARVKSEETVKLLKMTEEVTTSFGLEDVSELTENNPRTS